MAVPVSGMTGWTIRDTTGAVIWARGLLWLHAGFTTLALLISLGRSLEAPSGGGVGVLVGIGQSLAFFAAALVTLVWIYRANANAHALGAMDMMFRPGWAVACFFIPLANLVMPFLAMRELWKASANPTDWQLERTHLTMPLWWACWLISGISVTIAFRLTIAGEQAASGTQMLYFVSDAFAVPSALLLASLVGRIEAMQRRALPAVALA